MKRALVVSFLLAATVAFAAPTQDELTIAEWISTGARAEHMVLPRLRDAIEFLRVDPQGQTATNAVRLLGERLAITQVTMKSIRDSVVIFEQGLATEPSRQFCEEMLGAIDRAKASLDTAQMVVADMKRDSTLIESRRQDLTRPFQTIGSLRWSTDALRGKVLEAAERVRASRR